MPQEREEIRYQATLTHDTGGLFDPMEATVEIPVRPARSKE